MRGGDVDAGQALAQLGGDPLLMARVQVREEEADRDRLGAGSGDRRRQSLRLVLRERLDDSLRPDPLRRLEAQLVIDQRCRLRRAEAVEVGPVLAAYLEQVGEAAGGDERRPRPAFLQQGVGGDGHPVGEDLDVARRGTGPAQHRLDRAHHPGRLLPRRRRHLGGVDGVGVEQDGVGKGPADVDPEQHAANATPLRGRCRPARR
jgi:hypothetical protein